MHIPSLTHKNKYLHIYTCKHKCKYYVYMCRCVKLNFYISTYVNINVNVLCLYVQMCKIKFLHI